MATCISNYFLHSAQTPLKNAPNTSIHITHSETPTKQTKSKLKHSFLIHNSINPIPTRHRFNILKQHIHSLFPKNNQRPSHCDNSRATITTPAPFPDTLRFVVKYATEESKQTASADKAPVETKGNGKLRRHVDGKFNVNRDKSNGQDGNKDEYVCCVVGIIV